MARKVRMLKTASGGDYPQAYTVGWEGFLPDDRAEELHKADALEYLDDPPGPAKKPEPEPKLETAEKGATEDASHPVVKRARPRRRTKSQG